DQAKKEEDEDFAESEVRDRERPARVGNGADERRRAEQQEGPPASIDEIEPRQERQPERDERRAHDLDIGDVAGGGEPGWAGATTGSGSALEVNGVVREVRGDLQQQRRQQRDERGRQVEPTLVPCDRRPDEDRRDGGGQCPRARGDEPYMEGRWTFGHGAGRGTHASSVIPDPSGSR